MKFPVTTSGMAPGGNTLVDNFGRQITYLRLAVTDRCNLRCIYCRPAGGLPFIPHNEILRFEELERLTAIFCRLGISKVRITGGEPFSRRGSLDFLKRIKAIDGLESLHITTNGVKTSRHLDELKEIGIAGINLSLDTLDPDRFLTITRRDFFDGVLATLHGVLACGIPLKINSVVLDDTDNNEIIKLAELTKQHPVTLRFIERMPFSGGKISGNLGRQDLFSRLLGVFPDLEEDLTITPTTARTFFIPGHRGKIGVIAGYSRLFCKTCNKVRITPVGMLKTCLYDNGALDLKTLLRSGKNDAEITEAVIASVQNRFINGLEAEQACTRSEEPSMSAIGG